MSQAVSFAAFGKSKGVSRQAVAKAQRSGRLHASIGRDAKGRVCIADAALASTEWNANVRQPPNDGRRRKPANPEEKSPAPDGLIPLEKFSVFTSGSNCVIVNISDDSEDEGTTLPLSRLHAFVIGCALVSAANLGRDEVAAAAAQE